MLQISGKMLVYLGVIGIQSRKQWTSLEATVWEN